MDLSEERKEWIKDRAKEIAELRATAKSSRYTGGLTSQVYREFPSRLCKQLRQIWISLMNLKDDYPEERAESIINQIAKSCGDPIRLRVRRYMRGKDPEWMSISEVARDLNLGKKTVYSDLQILSALGRLEREEKMRNNNKAECFRWAEEGEEEEEEEESELDESDVLSYFEEVGESHINKVADHFEDKGYKPSKIHSVVYELAGDKKLVRHPEKKSVFVYQGGGDESE